MLVQGEVLGDCMQRGIVLICQFDFYLVLLVVCCRNTVEAHEHDIMAPV